MQLLVHRGDFFVAGLQLLVGRLELLDAGAQLRPARAQLGLQVAAAALCLGFRLLDPGLRARRGALLPERHEQQPGVLLALQRRRGDGDTAATIGTPGNRGGPLLLRRLPDHCTQLAADAASGEGEQIAGRLAIGMGEVGLGVAVEVDDPLLRVEQNGRGCEARQRLCCDAGGVPARPGRRRRGVLPADGAEMTERREVDEVVARGARAPVDAVLLVEGHEQVLVAPDALRRTQQQHTRFAQGEVQQRQHALLDLGLQVNEHVAAGDDVDARKRRVAQQILGRENDLLANVLRNLPACFDLVEELFQPLCRYMDTDALGVDAGACVADDGIGGVGGENLHLEPLALGLRRLLDEHGEAVRLLARAAACNPAANHFAVQPLGDERAYDPFAERFPYRWVAEKTGHVDQQVLQERIQFLRIVAQQLEVVLHRGHARQRHSAPHTAQDGRSLVGAQIVRRAGAQEHRQVRELALIDVVDVEHVRAAPVVGEQCRHPVDGQDPVHQPRVDGVPGHAGKFRRGGILRQHDAPVALHLLQAGAAVGAGAREHDRDRAACQALAEGNEQLVHRTPAAARFRRFTQPQPVALDRERAVRHDDVDVVRLDPHAVLDVAHGHGRAPREDLADVALPRGIQVKDEHECHAGVGRHGIEQCRGGLQAACRRAHADDRKWQGRLRRRDARVLVRPGRHPTAATRLRHMRLSRRGCSFKGRAGPDRDSRRVPESIAAGANRLRFLGVALGPQSCSLVDRGSRLAGRPTRGETRAPQRRRASAGPERGWYGCCRGRTRPVIAGEPSEGRWGA